VPGPTDRETAAGLGSLGYRLALIARQARAEFYGRLGEAGTSFASWTVLETLAVWVRGSSAIWRDRCRSA
jgi:hypothetical protein